MESITKDSVVNYVLKRYPKTISVFSKYNIDICCGGNNTIEQAVKKKNLYLDEVLKSLNEIIRI